MPPGAWWGQAAGEAGEAALPGESPAGQGAPGDAVDREDLVSRVLRYLAGNPGWELPPPAVRDQLRDRMLSAYDQLAEDGSGAVAGRGPEADRPATSPAAARSQAR